VKSALIYARLPPDAVIRDPDFVFSLPKEPSVTSGPNAMAHAVAALYARDRIAEIGKLAVWGLTAFAEFLPRVLKDTNGVPAREKTPRGAWACGAVMVAR